MLKLSSLKVMIIATIACLGMIFLTTARAQTSTGIEIEYRNFSGVITLGPPADEYATKLAQMSAQMLGKDKQISFKAISPRPEIPNGDIVTAVGAGGKLVDGSGFDAAYVSGSSLNPVWGFIYNSGIPVSGVSFDRFLGFLYGNSTEQSGIELAQTALDRRNQNIIAIPLVGGPPQGSGYFPQPVSDTDRESGIGLAGLCQQPWTFRYLPPAQNVLDLACDRLVGADKKINFVTAVPGGRILDEVISGKIQAFEFVTPKDDFNLFFADSEKPNLSDLGLNYLHYPSWHQPFLITYLIINRQVWQMLSVEQQNLITTSARANLTDSYAQNLMGQGEALQKILDISQNNNTMTLVKWSDRDLESLRAASDEFIKLRGEDNNFSVGDRQDYQSILSAYQKYLESDRNYWSRFIMLPQN